MVCASQPLAAQAGLDMLKAGGNAVDAAIATAACLTVVEPTSNGIGSDAFALLFVDGQLHGLNASGPTPRRISIQELEKNGYNWVEKDSFEYRLGDYQNKNKLSEAEKQFVALNRYAVLQKK